MSNKSDNKKSNIPLPGSSKDPGFIGSNVNDPKEEPKVPWRKRCCRYMYDREKKTFCGRTCKSWFYMIVYSIMYLIFLSTYTLIFLFGSLMIIKVIDDYQTMEKTELLTYRTQGIGLTATPTSLYSMPVIWYRNEPNDYQKYVDNLERLLSKRRKREANNVTDLGPCGTSPFGYGSQPCVIIRINKQFKWSARPMNISIVKTLNIPIKVQNWLQLKRQKLWLHCDGYHSYDKEHIGQIKYFPDPPGFDPAAFPLDKHGSSPLIAVQFTNFTIGISLAVECKLWYDGGISKVEFMLYVTPKRR